MVGGKKIENPVMVRGGGTPEVPEECTADKQATEEKLSVYLQLQVFIKVEGWLREGPCKATS